MARLRRSFKVTLTLPKGMGFSDAYLKDYICYAVASMKGCLAPDEPIFDLDGSKIRVTSIKPARGKT